MLIFNPLPAAAGCIFVALTLLSSPAAFASEKCQDLDFVSYERQMSSGVAVLDLLEDIATRSSWSVQSSGFGAWRGPVLRGSISFPSSRDAIHHIIHEAAGAGWPIAGRIDKNRCSIIVFFSGDIPSAPSSVLSSSADRAVSPAVPGPEKKAGEAKVLLAGATLSSRLAEWLQQQGWSMTWSLDYDYFLEKDLPLIEGNLNENIDYILKTYQSQGGLIGVRARIAQANRVVVFEGVDYAAR